MISRICPSPSSSRFVRGLSWVGVAVFAAAAAAQLLVVCGPLLVSRAPAAAFPVSKPMTVPPRDSSAVSKSVTPGRTHPENCGRVSDSRST